MNAACLKETTSLHVSSVYGFADVVKVLIEKGADVNARMQGDVTPLHLSSSNGRLSRLYSMFFLFERKNQFSSLGKTNVMEILIKNGAEINAKTAQGNTPLHNNAANGKDWT